MTINSTQTSETRREHPKHVAARASASDFERALQACDFAVLVWELPDGAVWLANERAAELFGVPLVRMPGTKHVDLVGPSASVSGAFAALGSGAVEVVSAERRIRTSQRVVRVRVWSRAIELDDTRAVVSLYVPTADVGRLGRDPSGPWRDLAPLAIGTTDLDWQIHAVSSDIREIVGLEPAEAVGTSMLDLVYRSDVQKLLEHDDRGRMAPRSHCYVRFQHRDGGLVDVCVLVAPLADGERAFTLITVPHASAASPGRIAELELRLRHIGAEVRAAGVLEELDVLPAASDHPQLGELTSRQWEILSRLMRGERVPTIADSLFVSKSTVRNHLASIYARFGVHSQAELLDALRRPSVRIPGP